MVELKTYFEDKSSPFAGEDFLFFLLLKALFKYKDRDDATGFALKSAALSLPVWCTNMIKLFDVALMSSKCSWAHASKMDITSKQKFFHLFLSITDEKHLKRKKTEEFYLEKKCGVWRYVLLCLLVCRFYNDLFVRNKTLLFQWCLVAKIILYEFYVHF